ncbi:MAG: SAM hydroxide adenosyltransferase [Roseibacillus sp.]
MNRKQDATQPIPQYPSTAQVSLTGSITHLNESWGNLTTSFVASDLETLGVKLNDELLITSGDNEQVVTLTQHYSLLPQGKGAAYLTPNGYLVLQINGKNLAKELNTEASDKLTLSKN